VLTQLIPEATIYGSREAGVLIATATKEQHERIAAVVKEADADRPNSQTRVFGILNGSASSLRDAVQGFAPEASVVADRDSNSLIVTGTDTELEQIAQVVEELNSQPTIRPSLKAFVLEYSSPELVATALQTTLGRRAAGGVNFSRETNSVFVVGSRDELLMAEELIQQIDVPSAPDVRRKLRSFALGAAAGSTVVDAIESLFAGSASRVDVNYDMFNEQLLVTAEPAQLDLVEETLKQFAPPKRELEIIQLETADPYSFKMAADALFEDEPSYAAPSITIDSDQQRVLVRATSEQHQNLRQLLQQMGEQTDGIGRAQRDVRGSGRVRFVPMVRNSDKLLEQMERLWPSVRDNPLKIIRPNSTRKVEVPEIQVPENPAGDTAAEGVPAMPSAATADTQIVARAQPVEEQAPPTLQATDADMTDAETTDQLPPLVVVPNSDRWTIASEDAAALDQFERLLAMVLSPKVEPFATTGNYSVYLLQHAGADNIQELLTELFRPADRTQRTAISDLLRRVKIVADARINALIVHGSRADRSTVEQLLGVLDSEDLVDTLQQITPTMLPLKNADADNVVGIIRDVYRSQLSSGAGRRPVSIPEGLSSEVATLLQQINAQAAGPLLTVAVDASTNSIVMRAPAELSRELVTFVESLDQQAVDAPSRRVDLIQLKSTNTKNVERALKILLSR